MTIVVGYALTENAAAAFPSLSTRIGQVSSLFWRNSCAVGIGSRPDPSTTVTTTTSLLSESFQRLSRCVAAARHGSEVGSAKWRTIVLFVNPRYSDRR